MKSDRLKYLFVIVFTTTLCAVKNGHCLSIPLSSNIHPEHANRVQIRNLNSNDTANSDSVSEILQFWKEQEDRLNIGSQKDIIIFLGDTGTGKSAVISFLTVADLESVEIYEGSETFRIVDKFGRISQNSTILSQTLVPELIVDNETGAAYFDCPGFKDTRGVKYDITITYLIRKLLESANSVKFVFVIAHSHVSDGGDRRGILDLARHANNLIKNIDKFSNGIGLVVTKVENVAKISKGSITVVDDNRTLKGIRRFLSRAKNDLETLSRNGIPSTPEVKINKGAIKFIEILLSNETIGQSRIGLLRKPAQSGLLRNMLIFEEEKNAIKTIINQNLQYVQKQSGDFGFTLSDESKNRAYSLISEIGNRSAAHISVISDEIIDFFTNQEKDYTRQFDLYIKASSLSDTLNGTIAEDPQIFLKNFVNALKATNIDRITKSLNQIQKYIAHIDFLTNLTEGSALDLSHISGALFKVIQKMDDYLNRLLGKIENRLLAQVLKAFNRIEAEISKEEHQNFDLIYLKDLMFDAQRSLPTIGDDNDIRLFLQQLIDSSILKKGDTSLEYLMDISSTIDFFNYSQVDLSSSCKLSISNEADKIVKHFKASNRWYNFLIELYEKMSEMNLKSNSLSYDEIKNEANELIEKCSFEETQKMNVSEIGLQEFLTTVGIETNYDVESLQINAYQSKALKTVLNVTLNDDVKCSADGSTITGFNVRMSDAIGLRCWHSSSAIKVFALDKILIDVDIDRTSDWKPKQLSIIAPIWKVFGKRRINLNGISAQNFWSAASDGNSAYIHGRDGLPGKSGSSAGSFFGVGNEFEDASMLSVQASGGNGGSGQNGGTGYYSKVKKGAPTGVGALFGAVLGFLVGGPPGAIAGGAAGGGLGAIGSEFFETIGTGGNGGAAGSAGSHGDIQIIGLKNDPQISMSSLDGTNGKPGEGAYSGDWNQRGQDGNDGIVHSKPAIVVTKLKKLQIIKKYKDFVENSAANNIRRTTLKNFIEAMERHQLI